MGRQALMWSHLKLQVVTSTTRKQSPLRSMLCSRAGTVNVLDMSIIGQKYGESVEAPYPRWGVNQDGVINVQDMTLVAYHFGEIVA